MNASLLDKIDFNGNMLDSRPVFTKAIKKRKCYKFSIKQQAGVCDNIFLKNILLAVISCD